MSRKVWIQGPIAVDTILYLPAFPTPGSFMNAIRSEVRPGGSGANIALALSTTSIETGFISYIGNDENGVMLQRTLDTSNIKNLSIIKINGATSHALILVDDKSERTIISMTKPYLRELRIENTPIEVNDVVVFVLWREEFILDLLKAQNIGCFTVVGASAFEDQKIQSADLLIGSRADFSEDINPQDHLHRFNLIVLTDGLNGAFAYSKEGVVHQPAFQVQAVDATGAGDAFITGFLAGLAHGLELTESLEIAAKWAASSVQINASIPPAFEFVKQEWGLELEL